MKYHALALQLSCVLLLISVSVQISTKESDHYVAAVLEYNRDADTSKNLAAYIGYIRDAALEAVDIIVFPEATLNRADLVSVEITAEGQSAPCDDEANAEELLFQLSCAARDHTMYVVVNLFEVMNCTESEDETKCPENIVYEFNTNVVFDRDGRIIDKYRKINLFGEYGRTPSLDSALGVFTTDFGVTFGHFICFDLMFQAPAVQVVQKSAITDVIFPTMWFSEGPFLTAVSIQEAYARALNVNFLAAGANNIAVGSGGTGIYSGSAGAIVAYMPGVNGNRMLVATVPKVPGTPTEANQGLIANEQAAMDGFFLKQDQSIPFFASQLIEVQDSVQSITVTQGDVVCNFEILTDTGRTADADPQKYYYRAVAFDGVRTFDGLATGGSKLCAILACQTEKLETCGTRFPIHSLTDTTLFSLLSITATVPTPTRNTNLDADNTIYYPVSLQKNILPLPAAQLTYKETRVEDDGTTVSLVLKESKAELLAIGVWGRVFPRDGMDQTGSTSRLIVNPALLVFTLISASFLAVKFM